MKIFLLAALIILNFFIIRHALGAVQTEIQENAILQHQIELQEIMSDAYYDGLKRKREMY